MTLKVVLRTHQSSTGSRTPSHGKQRLGFVSRPRQWPGQSKMKSLKCNLFKLLCLRPSVWPDVDVKHSPNSSNNCPKSSFSSFFLKSDIVEKAQKVTLHLGHFCTKICDQELLKSPNLVTGRPFKCSNLV